MIKTETISTSLAPVALFVYNRPEHTRKTLESLQENPEMKETPLFVFCDGPKQDANPEIISKIQETRDLFTKMAGVGKLTVIAQEKNQGLAKSIIDGVSYILRQYKKLIVLEDDIITSPHFLAYMNQALKLYENEKEVKQVSGFAFNHHFPKRNASYLVNFTSTWGWAVWERSWKEIDFSCKGAIELLKEPSLKAAFNLNNSYNYSGMLMDQLLRHTNDSWAVRFWWNVFRSKGLVLNPDYPLVQNIGFDNSGVHFGEPEKVNTPNWDNSYCIKAFPDKAVQHEGYMQAIIDYLKSTYKHFKKEEALFEPKSSFIKWLTGFRK